MFTGIINTIGKIDRKGANKIIVSPKVRIKNISPKASISVNGACLTVLKSDFRRIYCKLSPETLKKTNLGDSRSAKWVNLELPLEVGKSLDGHLVYGHIDTLGRIEKITRRGSTYLFSFLVGREFDRFLVEKGAIALDGISLTPFNIHQGRFDVSVLAFTYESTNLQYKKVGHRVNVEFDILAKYMAKLMKGAEINAV